MPTTFSFDRALLLRTPSFPFMAPAKNVDDFTQNVLSDRVFLEAVYLASPSLHRAIMAYLDSTEVDTSRNRRTVLSALNYHTRMSSRCTPFGLFAGCSLAHWVTGESTNVPLRVGASRRFVTLNVSYLQQLIDYICGLPAVGERLVYYANSSLYEVGNEVRYVERTGQDGTATYQVCALDNSDYLQKVLAISRNGGTYQQLLTGLAELDVSAEDASRYVNELIACQVLLSELSPTVTGGDLLVRILEILATVYQATNDVQTQFILTTLTTAETHLNRLCEADTAVFEYSKCLWDALSVLPVPVPEGNLIHTDLFHELTTDGLSEKYQTDLMQAFELLNRLTVKSEQKHLSDFKTRFYARYEEQEIPLLTALDASIGIGYGPTQVHSGTSSLIADLQPNPDQPIPLESAPDSFRQTDIWLRKLQTAQQTQAYSISVTDADVAACPPATDDDLPPSLSAMFRIVTDNDGKRWVLSEGFGGSSAVNVLSRFGTGHDAIHETINRVTGHEQAQNPDVVLAEVLHLPSDSVANVLRHPPVRAFEIPYLTPSSLPLPQQIPVQDLLISVRNGTIRLRSGRLNQVVIPRLSNAHNYRHKSLPLYEFLADMQLQNKRSRIAFSWGNLSPYYAFFPRVTYGNCILGLAIWYIYADELKTLTGSEWIPSAIAIQTVRRAHRLPRFTVLVDGDHELLTDWESPLSVAALVGAVRQERVMLREFLADQSDLAAVTNAAGRPVVNQFVGLLVKNKRTYTGTVLPLVPTVTAVQRSFAMGSEWLYVKLYADPQLIDKLLTDVVQPLISELSAANQTDVWFFVRYADPEHHLRLRLHLHDPQVMGEIVEAINGHTQSFREQGLLRNMVFDTYVRELERYGPNNIHHAETLFQYHSEAILDLLLYVPEEQQDPIRWLWTLRAIDHTLDAFGLLPSEKQQLVTTMRDAFGREFAVDLSLKKRIDQRYRQFRTLIQQWLSGPDGQDPLAPFPDLSTSLNRWANQVRHLAEASRDAHNELPIASLLGSYLHLLVNRAIVDEQRFHELLLYDFLARHYESELARRKSTPPSPTPFEPGFKTDGRRQEGMPPC